MHDQNVNSRGRDLETAEDTLKVISSMLTGKKKVLTTSKNIIYYVNIFREKQGKPTLSERTIRKTLSFLLRMEVLEIITTPLYLIDNEGIVSEKKALRSAYQISIEKVRINNANLDLEVFKKEISKLPRDIQQSIAGIKRKNLIDSVLAKMKEDSSLIKTIGETHDNGDSRVKAVINYLNHKHLREIMTYLRRVRE